MSQKVVVLGAGFLGVNAALDLASNGEEVLLLDRQDTHEYIPSSIDLLRGRVQRQELEIELEEFLPEEVEFKQVEVEDIRSEEKTVETRNGLIGFDKIVIALGGEPAEFGADISQAENVWGLEPAQNLTRKTEDVESALIVGAGYVGVETAGELEEKGIDVTMVDAGTRPMGRLDEKSSEKILEILQEKNICFKGGKTVNQVDENSVSFEDGGKEESDVVIWAAGVQASKTVQEIFDSGPQGVEVNQGLSVIGEDNMFAGGDCADIEPPKTAHKAMKQGEVVAENIYSDRESLKQIESGQNFLLLSFGDEAGLVFRDKLLFSSGFLRYFKDLVKTYYFTRLRIKKFLV